MIETSSVAFGNLRISSVIFGKCSKVFGNVRQAFGTILENLRKSSESGGNLRKIVKNGVINTFI